MAKDRTDIPDPPREPPPTDIMTGSEKAQAEAEAAYGITDGGKAAKDAAYKAARGADKKQRK